MELLGLAELAQLLGVSKQVVISWKVKREGFPKPAAELRSGPVWLRDDIVGWAQAEGVELDEPPEPDSSAVSEDDEQRHAIVVAMMNMKGGVGKSTLAVNLGWWGAASTHKRDFHVLLIDLDPQFNLSQYVMGQKKYESMYRKKAPTIASLFDAHPSGQRHHLRDLIHKERYWRDGSCLHIVPSSLELAWSIRYATERPHLLRDQLKEVRSDYDLVVIDCAPTESILSKAAYLASDYIFVPVKPEFLSTIGLPLLLRSLQKFQDDHTREEAPEVRGIIFNDSEDKKEHAMSRKSVREIAGDNGWYVFKNSVSHSNSYPAGARVGRPIFTTGYARENRILEFNGVAREFYERVQV